MDLNVLYSVLKDTREGKDNTPLDRKYSDRIKSKISIKDIENMSGEDVKETVINYLESILR